TGRSISFAIRSSLIDVPAYQSSIPSTSCCSSVNTSTPSRSAALFGTSSSRRQQSHGRLGGTMSRIGVAGGSCLCLLLPRLNGDGSSPIPRLQANSLIEHDTTVAAQQPGPHGGGGVTTAYSFFAE